MTKTQFVKFLEFFSVIGFVAAYFWKKDLLFATTTLMILMTVFVVAAKLLKEPLNKLQIGTWAVVLVLGSITLLAKDGLFIKWKTTVINSVLAVVFAGSHFVGKKTILQHLLESRIKAPAPMLRRLNAATVCYFLLIASLNLLFAYRFSDTAWVNFKFFGTLILNFLFIGGGLFYLRDYLKDFLEKMEKK